jgi:hypothetical protein
MNSILEKIVSIISKNYNDMNNSKEEELNQKRMKRII